MFPDLSFTIKLLEPDLRRRRTFTLTHQSICKLKPNFHHNPNPSPSSAQKSAHIQPYADIDPDPELEPFSTCQFVRSCGMPYHAIRQTLMLCRWPCE